MHMSKGILQLAVSRKVLLELEYREFPPQLEAVNPLQPADRNEISGVPHLSAHVGSDL